MRRGALVGLLVVLFAGNTVAAASGEVFERPSFMEGDVWTYTNDDGAVRWFEWRSGRMLDASGSQVEGSVLVETMYGIVPCDEHRPVERRALWNQGISVVEDVTLDPDYCYLATTGTDEVQQYDMQSWYYLNSTTKGTPWMPCGIESPPRFQAGDVFASAGCPEDLAVVAAAGSAAEAVADGVRVLWTSSVPVPVEIQEDEHTWSLTGFQAGTRPLTASRVVLPATIESTDLTETLGVQGPTEWALYEALEYMQDTVSDERLSTSQLVAARFTERTGDPSDEAPPETPVLSWQLQWHSTAGPWAFDVMKWDSEVVLGIMLPEQLNQIAATEITPWLDGNPGPPAGDLPRVDEVTTHWMELTGKTPNAWGFAPCLDCLANEWMVWSGINSIDHRSTDQIQDNGAYLRGTGKTARIAYTHDIVAFSANGTGWQEYDWSPRLVQSWTGRNAAGTGLAPPPEPLTEVSMDASIVRTSLAVGVAVAGIGALVLLWLKLAPVFGFSRQIKDHPTRERILRHVEKNPGIHLADIQRLLGSGHNVTTHHLDRLVAQGRLVAKTQGGFRCYFVVGCMDSDLMSVSSLLKAPAAAALVRTLVERPGSSGREIAEALEVSPATVSFHAKRLEAHGVVEATREGRSLRLSLSAKGMDAFHQLRPSRAVPA